MSISQDVRYAFRTFHKAPGFSVVAILTLALGMGANTAIFSVVNAVLLRDLPYRDPGCLVLFTKPTVLEDFEAWKSQTRSLEAMAVYYKNTGFSRVTLTGGTEPESIQGAFVSADFFPLMGIAPRTGRAFGKDEEIRRERVVILSDGLSKKVSGTTLDIDGAPFRVIGVMPPTFQFPARHAQFWAPITTNRYWLERPVQDSLHTRGFYARWNVVARLKPDATVQQAEAELNPKANIVPLRVELGGNIRLALYVLLAAVSFVLLIACCNVANLLLARGAAREREMAIRSALGAARARLIAQMLTESATLSVISVCVGLLIANAGVRALVAYGPRDIPRLEETRLDERVFVFTLGISVLAAILFGLVPAWKISRHDPVRRTRGLLVVAEFALSMILLTVAGLLIRSFTAVQSVDPGFEPQHVLTVRIGLPAGASDVSRRALIDAAMERARTLPGVRAAGAIDGLFQLEASIPTASRNGPDSEGRVRATWKSISGDYLQAMGAVLSRGRYFSDQDRPGSPLVAIIDESMAQHYWPGEDAIGKRFRGFDARGHNDDWLTVIGVIRDMHSHGLERDTSPYVFQYGRQSGDVPSELAVRTAGDAGKLAAALRDAVRSLNRTAILSNVTTVEQQLSDQISPRRFQTWLLALFSLIALVLATIGIYAVMHYSVAQRTHEIGIRMALGAQMGDVAGIVLRQGLTLTLFGLGIGLAGALWLTRLLAAMLFSVTPTDPVTFTGVSLLLIAVSLVAISIPAWRAARVDPLEALRRE
jgi:predicted permease